MVAVACSGRGRVGCLPVATLELSPGPMGAEVSVWWVVLAWLAMALCLALIHWGLR